MLPLMLAELKGAAQTFIWMHLQMALLTNTRHNTSLWSIFNPLTFLEIAHAPRPLYETLMHTTGSSKGEQVLQTLLQPLLLSGSALLCERFVKEVYAALCCCVAAC